MKKFGKVVGIILFIILIALVIFFGITFGISQAKYDGKWGECLADIFSNLLGGTETKYILVMGVSEGIEMELTDTIMVAAYNPDTNNAFLLSIPRDTFVGESEYYATANDKINAKYSESPQSAVKAAEEVTGLNIDGYIVIKTSVLVEIVDLIGGVEFDVPIDMDYDDPTQDLHIHLSKGMQTIYGDEAEQLLRFRHNNDGTSYPASYGDNDYGRMKTQRDFITETAKQLLKFKNITKINNIINAVSDNLITDMKTKELLAYVPKLTSFDTSNLASEQVPCTSKTINGISFVIYDEDETRSLVNNLVAEMNSN